MMREIPVEARSCRHHLSCTSFNVVDLVVTRHRLLLSGGRIAIDVVTPAVTNKHAPMLFELPDQRAALHSAICLVL